ncbi:MAG: hypothetical protein R3F49_13950 [Planctomycetota bacterium]
MGRTSVTPRRAPASRLSGSGRLRSSALGFGARASRAFGWCALAIVCGLAAQAARVARAAPQTTAPQTTAPQTTALHRAVLMSPGGELVFGLSTVLAWPVGLSNGAEHVPIEVAAQGERLTLRMPPYDSELVLDVTQRHGDSFSATGTWTKRSASGEQALAARVEPWPYVVTDGRGESGPTFQIEGEPLDVAGRWKVQFDGEPYPAVGVFAAVEGCPGEVRWHLPGR